MTGECCTVCATCEEPASPRSATRIVTLPLVTVRIFDETRYVETVLPSGAKVGATREPTPENIAQAVELGYGEDVWTCLIEHEVSHSILADGLSINGVSNTLRFQAGEAPHIPYFLRLWEEAIVLAFQRHVRTDRWSRPLMQCAGPKVAAWRERLREALR